MKITIMTFAMIFVLFGANAQSKKKVRMKSPADSVSYCIGISIGNSIKSKDIGDINPELISIGISASMNSDSSLFTVENAEKYLRDYFSKKFEAEAAKKLESATKFMQDNKKNSGMIELPSGLQYIVISEGQGGSPTDTDYVKVHYKGSLVNGKVFDNSYDRGQPAEFGVTGVIPGFSEALKNMKPGAKWKIFIPPHLAYGAQGAGEVIGPNEVLIFEVELLEITAPPAPTENYDYENMEIEGD